MTDTIKTDLRALCDLTHGKGVRTTGSVPRLQQLLYRAESENTQCDAERAVLARLTAKIVRDGLEVTDGIAMSCVFSAMRIHMWAAEEPDLTLVAEILSTERDDLTLYQMACQCVHMHDFSSWPASLAPRIRALLLAWWDAPGPAVAAFVANAVLAINVLDSEAAPYWVGLASRHRSAGVRSSVKHGIAYRESLVRT